MCSLVELKSNYLITTNSLHSGQRKCGDVSISSDVDFLTLHCCFCDYGNEHLDTFLHHLKSEHLKVLATEPIWLLAEKQESPARVKQETGIEETKIENCIDLSLEYEADPLMPGESKLITEKLQMKCENIDADNADDGLPLNSILNKEINYISNAKNNKCQAERPKVNHTLKIIDQLQEHPTLWNTKLRSRYIRKERQQAVERIAKQMNEEFPNIRTDYKYILAKVNKLKQIYFNYSNGDQKYKKNYQIFYEKLHFLNGHEPKKHQKQKCTLCHMVVIGLAKHMKRQHRDNDVPQICKVCQGHQPSERHLKMHLRSVHHRYECEYCDQWYAVSKTLKKHIGREHADKPQPPVHPKSAILPLERICEYCGRQFGSCAKLNLHKKVVHLQLRPYVCTECPKAFKKNDKLKSHMNSIHLNLRSHVCDVCSKGFFDRKTLVQHMRLHSDIMNYVCKVCGNGFRQAPALHSHMKTHQSQVIELTF